ncbi:hypothetical protein ACSBR2_002182 [Camellia fascicularis]
MANHHNNTSFFLDKKDFVLIKPSKPTPSHILSLSALDSNPNLDLLCQTLYVYNSNGTDHNDPACVIKEALSRVLVHYYPLAGKLKRHNDGIYRIDCNADGVPFLEATATCSLSSLRHLNEVDVETTSQFVIDVPTKRDGCHHPLVLQMTKFSCGGFTIGLGLSHSVCDGFGASQFFRAMAELASGKTEPSVKPVWERERLAGVPSNVLDQIQSLVPEHKASLATSPYLLTTDVVHECFDVKAECITKLKMGLMKENESITKLLMGLMNETSENGVLNESFTTTEALAAYIWRSRFRSLKLNPDGNTVLSLAVGIRQLLNPPLPSGYYGNAFVPTDVELIGKDLNEGPLSKVAKLIKESKKMASKTEYIKNAMSIFETIVKQQHVKMESNGATMVLTDWRQLSLLGEVDFGWKASVNLIPLPWKMFGFVDLCIFMPPCSLDFSMKGGVRVCISLPRAAMAKFKEEMSALEHGDYNGLIF